MNFNGDFADTRSILNHCDEFVDKLNRIQIFAGNEDTINEVIRRLKECLTSKHYLTLDDGRAVNEFAHQLRRITFYLMLNTDGLQFEHNIQQNDGIVHLLDDSAPISKCVLLSVLWSLDLGRYFAESIAHTPHWYAQAFFDKVVETLKHQPDSFQYAETVQSLVVGIYQNIVRSDQHRLDDTDRFRQLKPSHDLCLDLINTFLLVDLNADRYSNWTNRKKSKHLGQVIHQQLRMISKCLTMFENKANAFEETAADRVFGCLSDDVGDKEEEMRPHFGQLVFDTLNKLNQHMLTTLQTNFRLVTVARYMDWAEIDLTEDETLQRTICESSYLVQQFILNDNRLAHDVATDLKTIAAKPQTVEEVIKNSNLGQIMVKLDSLALEPQIRTMWLDEFLSRGIMVFDNTECLDTLEGNIEYLSTAHVHRMIAAIWELGSQMEDINVDKVKDFIIECTERMTVQELLDTIKYSMSLTPFGVVLADRDFNMTCTQLLNRFTSIDIESNEPLQLLLQNPTRFFEKLIVTATKSDQQLSIFQRFIDSLPFEVSNTFVHSNITSLINQCSTMPADDVKRLSTLLVRLHSTQYADQSAFLKHIYEMMTEATQQRDLTAVSCLAESLHAILKSNSTSEMETATTAPLLVMCAIIADSYRWDLTIFSEQRVHLVELLLDIIHELRKRFLRVATELEKSVVLRKVAHLKATTRIYFQKLQQSEHQRTTTTTNQLNSQHPIEFLRFVMDYDSEMPNLRDLPLPELYSKLLSAIVRFTPKECKLIANYDLVREHWFLVMTLLNRIVSKRPQQDNMVACLRYSCQNLATVVRSAINPLTIDHAGKWAILHKYVKLIKDFEKMPTYEYLFMDAHYALNEIIQELKQSSNSHPVGDRTIEATTPGAVSEPASEAVAPAEDVGASMGENGQQTNNNGSDQQQVASRLAIFKEGLQTLRDCEAKQLVLQIL